MSHPLRIEVLYLVGAWGTGSCSTIAAHKGMPVANINFHVIRLVEAGCLRLHDKKQGRGSAELIYALTPAGQGVLELVARLSGPTGS